MRAQIKGLETATQNAKDGISLIQTAEGALTEVHSMLNRMVELATKAANGTYGQSERDKVQDEIFALLDDIDRVSEGTNFNGTNLLDGSLSKRDPSAATKAKLVMDTTNLSATVGAEGKASVRINGKMVTWDVKVATAGTKLEDGSVKFEDALKNAGFNDGDFTINYEDDKITIEAAADGKNRISAFKLTGAATTATTTATVSGTAGEDGLGKAARGAGADLGVQLCGKKKFFTIRH